MLPVPDTEIAPHDIIHFKILPESRSFLRLLCININPHHKPQYDLPPDVDISNWSREA
jgi:hypothetical protein